MIRSQDLCNQDGPTLLPYVPTNHRGKWWITNTSNSCNNCSLHAIAEIRRLFLLILEHPPVLHFLLFYAHERTFLSSSFFFLFSTIHRNLAFSSLLHTSETRKEFRFELLIADVRVLRKGIGFRLGRQSSRLCFQSTAICGVRSRSHSADKEKVARLERPESKMVSLTAILIYSDIYTRIYPAGDKWLDVCNCKRRRKNNF